ncbi:AAA family ATPase [uncultured Rhodospira sp.]|uniref:AAA family ATPase n=1 Tax=uncultured Rhodospira sp. TaxID=1936189 RepID=UPI002621C993|nr:AAA family ATPase [uncultured Rhodospira sp.]
MDQPEGHFNARGSAESYGPRLPMRTIDPTAWAGKPIPERRWMVADLVPHGSVTMLSGDGGLGKSLLTLQLAVASATGRHFLGQATEHCRVFGLYCEDDADEIHRRLADITRAESLGFDALAGFRFASRVGEANEFVRRDKFGKPQGPSQVFFDTLETAKRFGARLVILDGLHDLFDGNENSRPEARQFVNMLRRIALDVNGAVILCAHPSRAGLADGTGTSGSTAWNNAVRSRLYLSRPRETDDDGEDRDARTLSTKKSNYGVVGDELRIRWQEGVFVLDEPDTGFLGRMDARPKANRAEEAFLACLDAVAEQGRTVTDASNSPKFAPKVFATMPQARGIGRKPLEKAMVALFSAGTIKVGVAGHYANRTPIPGIVRTAPGAA